VAFALEVIEENTQNIRRRVMDVLDQVRLKNKARFLPDELSGGEQQRVSIARAIVNHPKILIADEPTGNLDPDTAWEIMHILEEINDNGTTVLMATHSQEIVNTIRKRVIAIDDGMVVRDEAKGEYGYEF
jgi:cell division transport system ATP-binding protein